MTSRPRAPPLVSDLGILSFCSGTLETDKETALAVAQVPLSPEEEQEQGSAQGRPGEARGSSHVELSGRPCPDRFGLSNACSKPGHHRQEPRGGSGTWIWASRFKKKALAWPRRTGRHQPGPPGCGVAALPGGHGRQPGRLLQDNGPFLSGGAPLGPNNRPGRPLSCCPPPETDAQKPPGAPWR